MQLLKAEHYIILAIYNNNNYSQTCTLRNANLLGFPKPAWVFLKQVYGFDN